MCDRTTKLNSASVKTSLVSERRVFYDPIMASMATISVNEQGVPCTEHLRGLVLRKNSVSKKNTAINVKSIVLSLMST